MDKSSMVELKGLKKSFGSQVILDHINLQVQQGEVVSLIGPSGTGKSTLLRCINYLERPDSGFIRVGDASIDNATANRDRILALRRSSAMVFQHYNLFRNKTAKENVMEALMLVQKKSRAEAEAIAIDRLNRVGLQDKLDSYPAHLSGGEQQRVGIARAVALEPKVLLFDEPTSALDPEMVGEVLSVIEDLTKRDMTMIIVTHEMAFARKVADKVIFLEGGSIVEEGKPSEVLDRPKNPRTSQFLNQVLR